MLSEKVKIAKNTPEQKRITSINSKNYWKNEENKKKGGEHSRKSWENNREKRINRIREVSSRRKANGGYIFSEKTKKRMSESMKKRFSEPETRKKLSEKLKNSEKAKMARKNLHESKEVREKISMTLKGREHSKERIENIKKARNSIDKIAFAEKMSYSKSQKYKILDKEYTIRELVKATGLSRHLLVKYIIPLNKNVDDIHSRLDHETKKKILEIINYIEDKEPNIFV